MKIRHGILTKALTTTCLTSLLTTLPLTTRAETPSFVNTSTTTSSPEAIAHFGTVFPDNTIPSGSGIKANGDYAQMDVRTSWPSGYVKEAEITLRRQTLAPGQTMAIDLEPAPKPGGKPISIKAMNPWRLNINFHNGFDAKVNVRALLNHALTEGKVTWWRQGLFATEGRFFIPLSGSFYLIENVTKDVDGVVTTHTGFSNDYAMGTQGRKATFSADILQDGVKVFHQPTITQYQYENWPNEVSTRPDDPNVLVAHDVAALEATGAIPAYDTSVPVQKSTLDAEASQLGGSTYGTLGPASILQYMPTTGGRADIGPQPLWVSIWLRAQTSLVAQEYALAQADAASGIPWHFRDIATNDWISVYRYPNLWLDPRATSSSSYTALTQPVDPTNNGWTTDTAHAPDPSYVAFILTGEEHYLDDVDAQAAWAVGNVWTYNRAGGGSDSSLGYVVNLRDQVREQAWNIRAIDEAAFASPDGSSSALYNRSLESANWAYLAQQIPSLQSMENAPYGYISGTYGGGTIAPWEQGYFESSADQAAIMGNTDAPTALGFLSHFEVEGFFQNANGFPPGELISYNLQVGDPNTSVAYPTWADIENNSQPNGPPNWPQSQGDYAQIAEMELAQFINFGVDQADACSALNYLQNSGAPYLPLLDTQWEFVPVPGKC